MCEISFITKTFFIIIFFTSGSALNQDTKYLVKLITDFRNLYGTINILIARSESFTEFRVATTYVSIQKLFSENNIFTTMTKITDLPKRIAYYNRKIDRPFFIIILRSMTDFYDFANVTSTVNMNLYQMLIIFTSQLMDFCQNPKGNPFNLVFDTYMIVKCQDYPILKEWYSLHPNTTKVADFLTWKPGINGFEKLKRCLAERRSSLEGISLRVTVMEDSRNKDGKINGFFGNVLTEISEAANFKMIIQPVEVAPGSYDSKTGKWSGVMGKLQENKTDIGVSEFTVTQKRLDIIDFSDPIYISTSKFYLKKSHESHVLWSMYYKAFGVRASYYLFAVLLVSPIFLAIILSRSSNTSFRYGVYDNYFNVWGIFCNKSPVEFPEDWSGRIAYYSLYILSFMLYSIYSALLVSYLTIFKPDIPFNSLDEFTSAKTHKIITVKNTSFIDSFKYASNDYSMRHLNNFLIDDKDLPSSLIEAINQICNHKKNIVLYMDEIILRSNRFKLPCELIPFERGRISSMGLAFTKNSPYVGLINFHLQRMRNFGLLNAIKNRNLKKPEPSFMTYKAVTVWSTLPMFAILNIGILLSILILIFENIVFHVNQRHTFIISSAMSKVDVFNESLINERL